MDLKKVDIEEGVYCEECDENECSGMHLVLKAESIKKRKEADIDRLVKIITNFNKEDIDEILRLIHLRRQN